MCFPHVTLRQLPNAAVSHSCLRCKFLCGVRSSSSVPAVLVPESDVSTETASSPCTDGSQSSVTEDSQKNEAEDVSPRETCSQEPSTHDSLLKELDRKLEIPASKDKDVKSRLVSL